MKQIKEGDYSTSGWLQVTKIQPVTRTILAVTVRDLQGKGKGRREQMRAFAKKAVDPSLIEKTDTLRCFMDGDFPAMKFFITLKEEQDWL